MIHKLIEMRTRSRSFVFNAMLEQYRVSTTLDPYTYKIEETPANGHEPWKERPTHDLDPKLYEVLRKLYDNRHEGCVNTCTLDMNNVTHWWGNAYWLLRLNGCKEISREDTLVRFLIK